MFLIGSFFHHKFIGGIGSSVWSGGFLVGVQSARALLGYSWAMYLTHKCSHRALQWTGDSSGGGLVCPPWPQKRWSSSDENLLDKLTECMFVHLWRSFMLLLVYRESWISACTLSHSLEELLLCIGLVSVGSGSIHRPPPVHGDGNHQWQPGSFF